jgi:thiol reductant ABC exporter CydD subunit
MRLLLGLPGVRRLAGACAVLALGVAALLVVQWWAVAAVVADVAGRAVDPGAVAGLLAVALGAWLARAGLVATRDLLAARTSVVVRRELRSRVARALLRQGPDAAGGALAGELVTAATAGAAKVDPLVARFVPSSVTSTVVPVAIALTVSVLDPASGALLVLGAVVVLLFLWLVGTGAAAASRAQWATLGQLGALLADTLRALPTLVAYRRGRDAAGWVGRVSDDHRVATMKVLRVAFLSGFVLELGATLSTALVAVTVGVRVFGGDLAFERGLLVLLLTPEFFAPLRALGADRHAALEGRPALDRLLALTAASRDPGLARAAGSRTGAPHVCLDDVTVAGPARPLLDAVRLELPPGSRTAVVGPSGAGKTTLLRVLLGFTAPDVGTVLVDGAPLDPDEWRRHVAYVPERPWLLPGTVADNVRLGRPGADDHEVEVALERAHALEFVRRLPHGIDTPLGEDAATLSGGERLRLALARAFVKDAPVVVLDEPTSQLDAASELEVLAALHELAEGRTLLTVTHRDAPLGLHDRLVRLEAGRVVEVRELERAPRPRFEGVPA